MRYVVMLAALLTGAAALCSAQDASPRPPAAPAEKAVYDESADAAEQIAAALDDAKRENRRVLIQWGANWCGWCVKLHGLFGSNSDVKRKLQYEYDVVYIDVGRFDKHMDVAAKYGADLKSNGIPFLTVLDADGAPLANRETGSLEDQPGSEPAHDVEKVMAFLTEHQAEYLSARAVLDGAIAEARGESKLAFVHFGAPWCPWCHRLDAFLAREDVRAVLDEHFVEVKIDTDRMIGGGEMLLEMRGSQRGGIPWFAFVDGDGEIVAHSSESGENIGYPAAEQEAAAFIEMLRKSRRAVTAAQLEFLRTELVNSVKPSAGH